MGGDRHRHLAIRLHGRRQSDRHRRLRFSGLRRRHGERAGGGSPARRLGEHRNRPDPDRGPQPWRPAGRKHRRRGGQCRWLGHRRGFDPQRRPGRRGRDPGLRRRRGSLRRQSRGGPAARGRRRADLSGRLWGPDRHGRHRLGRAGLSDGPDRHHAPGRNGPVPGLERLCHRARPDYRPGELVAAVPGQGQAGDAGQHCGCGGRRLGAGPAGPAEHDLLGAFPGAGGQHIHAPG